MQNNNNYANALEPDLRGSVDFDFFSNEEEEKEEKEEKTKDNLSIIEEDPAVSESSGENSLKSASIGELGGKKSSDRERLVPVERSDRSSSSSPASVSSPPPSRASSGKSASTIRSGGFPTISRGDSTRPMSPTPPSSHTSPSPHLLRSPNVQVEERPIKSPTDSKRSEQSISSHGSLRSGSREGRSDGSERGRTRDRTSPSPRSSSESPASSSRHRSVTPESRQSSAANSKRSPSPSSSGSRSRSRSSASSRGSFRGRKRSRSRSSSRSSRSSSRSDSRSSSSASSRSSSQKRKKETNGSAISSEESDVTDVSPLSSKNASPLGSPASARKPPPATLTRHHKDQVHFHASDQPEEDDQLNVELIMKAILELDRERQAEAGSGSVLSKRSASSDRRRSTGEKNYSFNSQRCLQIESENQRLLDSLLGQGARRRPNSAQAIAVPPRPYHSTINRIREQRRIEEENMLILKRLEKIRPTPNMSRQQQLRDYQRQANYGIILPGSKRKVEGQRSRGRKKTASKDSSALVGDDHSFKSDQTDSRPPSRALSASGLGSRPSSAASSGRPQTAKASERKRKPKAASSRPDWPSGW